MTRQPERRSNRMKQFETSIGCVLGVVGMATASDQVIAALSAVAAVVCAVAALVREIRAVWREYKNKKGDGNDDFLS